MIFGILGCLLLAFLFGGLESGLASVNRIRLRQRVRRGCPEAARLEKLVRHPTHLLAGLTLAHTVARLLGLLLFLVWLESFFSPVVALLVTLAALPVVILLVDFLPKCIFRAVPQRGLLRFFPFLHAVDWLLTPLYFFTEKILGRIGRPREESRPLLVTLNDLRQATNLAVEQGVLQPLQKHFIHSILNAHDVTVQELAVPLEEVPSLPGGTRVEEVLELSRRTGQTKWIVRGDQGGVLGQLRVFDLLLDETRQGGAQSYVRRIPEISDKKPLLSALLTMRTTRAQMALVDCPGQPPRVLAAETLIRRILLGASQIPPAENPSGGDGRETRE
jgi:CBS domain containing-hemolysin-like protein